MNNTNSTHSRVLHRLQTGVVRLGMCFLICLLFPMSSMGQEDASQDGDSAAASDTANTRSGQVMVTGDQLEFDQTNNLVTYTGNVKVVQDDTSMFSDTLVLHLAKQGSRKLQKAVATGNVRLVNNDITAKGEKGIFYNNEQKLELVKNATIWQGNNTISAHRILAFLDQEIIEGYSNETSGRAIMTVYSKDQVITPFGAPTGEEQAEEEQAGEGQSGEAAEPQAQEEASPIVIVSDRLKLDNSIGIGTFTGSVTATQQTTELTSDEMKVYLTQTEEEENDVEKIEVFGNVRIVQGTTTITGDEGFFQNDEQFAQVEGSAKKKARVEDKAQNLLLDAPLIKMHLDTKKIEAVRPKMIFESGEEETTQQDNGGTPEQTPSEQDKQSDVDRSDFPSVTLQPATTR